LNKKRVLNFRKLEPELEYLQLDIMYQAGGTEMGFRIDDANDLRPGT
jgi:hypothetical protein